MAQLLVVIRFPEKKALSDTSTALLLTIVIINDGSKAFNWSRFFRKRIGKPSSLPVGTRSKASFLTTTTAVSEPPAFKYQRYRVD